MLYKIEKRYLNKIIEPISIPKLVAQLINSIPNADIELIDYDYIGDATDDDFTSFAIQLYDMLDKSYDLVIITYTIQMRDKVLLRKMYRSWLETIPFSIKVITECKPVRDKNGTCENLIYFRDIQKIKTLDDLKLAVKVLFSGIFDTKFFMLYSPRELHNSVIDNWLEQSLLLKYDRHGYPREITVLLEPLYYRKGDCKVLYPYGGTDFGSFMIFEF